MSDLTPEVVEAALSIRGPGGISQSRTLTGSDHVIREAARKYANLTESGPIPATQCVFPLVKEQLLVYPTIERVSYDYSGVTEAADGQ